ncbi:DUF6371 domain-containing protein [Flavobacterium sp. ZB4P13]|uniref:DUF6371 domain-containing protein n=1 Tax=Flavobacterium sp. ZB4P13 TaxID=3401728 RepID=UPI003AB0B396
MKIYKYTLDKSSKKFVCPSCSKKNFVKYLETETNIYLSDEFGRCDRESSCAYHRRPETEFKNTFEVANIPKPDPSFHDLELVEKTVLGNSQNNFIQFLRTLFSEEEVNEVVRKYFIGTWSGWKGITVFWQINQLEKVHNGKVMMYEPTTGKRAKNKEGKGIISTVQSLLKLDDFILNQCLFGLHLINKNTKAVALVEAEKTAVIMSLFKPEYTWLATGSKGGFKYEFLKPIKQFKIVAFPDKSEYSDWLKKAEELNGFGFNIEISSFLENLDYPVGSDLADVYINAVNQNSELQYSEAELDEKRDQIVYSPESIEIHRKRLELKPAARKNDISKEESYRAIQYFADNDTDTFRL